MAVSVTAMRAFADDPVMRWLYPEDDVFFASGGEVFRPAMTGWIGLGEVWCTDDGVGAAIWIPPGRPEIDFTVDPPAPEPPPVQPSSLFDEELGSLSAGPLDGLLAEDGNSTNLVLVGGLLAAAALALGVPALRVARTRG